MINLDLGGWRRARVWREPLDQASYDVHHSLRHEILGVGAGAGSFAAVEVLIPQGGIIRYGLLGCRFAESAGKSLRVEVAVGTSRPRALDWTLLHSPRIDPVWAGIPEEFADAVMAGALESKAVAFFRPGVLTIDRGAYSDVGSSSFLSRIVISLVLEVLGPGADLAENDLKRLIIERLDHSS